ncbi:ATP-binding cassette domain-containing protein [Actinocorallia lasiicapitis]
MIGIAGPSGSGKSVLLATLATLRRPQTGTVELFGEPVESRKALRRARSRIGFLPSDARWSGGSTVHDFVSYAAYYQRQPGETVRQVLASLDLTDVASWQLGELSADLRVRAGLAAACVHSPDLAFLDEPLAGLAPHAVRELVPLLTTIAPTVIVTANDPADLAWCDQTFTLNAGHLATPAHASAERLVPPAVHRTLPHAASWSRRGALAHA